MHKIVFELSDDITLGTLRQIARATGQELHITLGSEPAEAVPVLRPPSRTPVADLAAEKKRLKAVLDEHGWNIGRVSTATGIHRRTLYSRIERWGIPRA